jgi:hypothetical protein
VVNFKFCRGCGVPAEPRSFYFYGVYMLKSKINLLALLVSASLLAACGDSTTNIVEKEPIPVEDDHDHDHQAGAGRLVISDKDSTMLRVYNL